MISVIHNHLIVNKGWGYEIWIVNKPEYCGKLLHFNANRKCSWHYHKLKDEVFYINNGALEITYGMDDDKDKAERIILNPGQSFHVPPGLRHQMRAINGPVTMFEFSTQHFDEDSYRVEKGD